MARARKRGLGEVDRHAAEELRLYAENDGDLYRQRYMPILKNLCKKRKKGVFDETKAVKGWMYYVDDAAKKYVRENGSSLPWNKMFSMETRRSVAAELARETSTQCGEHGLARGGLGRGRSRRSGRLTCRPTPHGLVCHVSKRSRRARRLGWRA